MKELNQIIMMIKEQFGWQKRQEEEGEEGVAGERERLRKMRREC